MMSATGSSKDSITKQIGAAQKMSGFYSHDAWNVPLE